jgi:cysteinyl-tRNA synthetase
VEETVMPYLTIMAEFRDSVRGLARQLKATEILTECDRLRDDTLPQVGVRLEDLEGERQLCLLNCVRFIQNSLFIFIISMLCND